LIRFTQRENNTSFILPALPGKQQPRLDQASADRPFELRIDE
jgi:hypothetical protein